MTARPHRAPIEGAPDRLTIDRLKTPIGEAMLAFDAADRLRAFYFADKEDELLRLLRRQYGANVRLDRAQGPSDTIRSLEAYFAGDLTALDSIECRTVGTPFQQAVWAALRTIPVGQTLSYGSLAHKIGKPKAVRAVGMANGANPIAVVVPCHRVIGSNGTLTGYGGGIERKRWLLTHEGASFVG
jgi:methylated-DNA-[protein]-cysteine S-methyltransferase